MSKSTLLAIILAAAALVVAGIQYFNQPVELASAVDPARFSRGVEARRAINNSQPVIVANAQSTGVPLVARANGTDVASIDRDGDVAAVQGTYSGLVSANAGLSLVGHLRAATAAPAALVTGTALAPGALLQPVSMATAGTVPLTIPTAGRIICVWNTGSQGVTIADSGNQVLAGNVTLGQYDTLCGVSDGTRFLEIMRSNN